jgi:copper chaperone CopZ
MKTHISLRTVLIQSILLGILAVSGIACQEDSARQDADDKNMRQHASGHLSGDLPKHIRVSGQTRTIQLRITGMVCQGCAQGITAMLENTDGVTSAEVSFADEMARIEYDSAKIETSKLVELIENNEMEMGFRAEVMANASTE